MKGGNFSYGWSTLDRVLKHLPALVAIVCLDLMWPLFGSGPFFTRVANFTLGKCSQYWWANLSFTTNFLSSIEMVSHSQCTR